MKVLQVIEQAFRATGEEQDDTILWLTRSMRGVGADLQVLLSGNAAYYAIQKNPAPALQFGDWQQTHPADIGNDIRELLASGVGISVVADDLKARGLDTQHCIDGVQEINRNQLASLYDSVDQVWQW